MERAARKVEENLRPYIFQATLIDCKENAWCYHLCSLGFSGIPRYQPP